MTLCPDRWKESMTPPHWALSCWQEVSSFPGLLGPGSSCVQSLYACHLAPIPGLVNTVFWFCREKEK